MTFQEALELVPKARAAGWRNVTVGPEDPHLHRDGAGHLVLANPAQKTTPREDCYVIGINPATKQREQFDSASLGPNIPPVGGGAPQPGGPSDGPGPHIPPVGGQAPA